MERLSVQSPLTERVYDALLDAICDGDLAPGSRLTQDELAARLDVSRQPVLQALLLLRSQGFVRDSGRRGVEVAPLDPAFIAHLYEVRSALDGVACRGAARNGAAEAALRGPALIAEGRAAVAAGSVGRMIAADIGFHQFLYALSGNPIIGETASLHWRHIRRAMGGYLGRYAARDTIWNEHEKILRAVARGDAVEAEALARRHCDVAGGNLVESISAEAARQAETPPRRKNAAGGIRGRNGS